MTLLNKYKDDFILFLESGFIAVNQLDEDSANKLFKAASLLQPNNVLPRLGMGYLHLHKLELKQAIQCFEEVLKKDPSNETAKALLGICMTFTPNQVTKGEKILEETGKSSDGQIKKLSHSALDFVEKFVKKEPSPVQIQKKGKPKKESRKS